MIIFQFVNPLPCVAREGRGALQSNGVFEREGRVVRAGRDAKRFSLSACAGAEGAKCAGWTRYVTKQRHI